MATETEVERIVVRLLGDSRIYKRALQEAQAAARNFAKEQAVLAKAEAEREKIMREGAAITRSVMTETERYNERVAYLKRLLEAGAISQETFNRAVSKAKQQILTASQATTDLSQKLSTIGNNLMAVGAIISGVFGGIGYMALQSAGRFEQTTIAFETFLGSAEEARRTLSDLTRYAAETPFTMPQILAAAGQLMQAGERGRELIKTLKMLGNAAAATSTDFGLLALIYNQVRGAGRLLMQDFRQLSTRMIVTEKDIAKFMGVSVAEFKRLMSEGKVTFEHLRGTLKMLSSEGERFYNMTERQSRSLLGLWSTVTDNFNILMRQIGQEAVPVVSKFLKFLIRLMENFETLPEPVKKAAAAFLGFGTVAGSVIGGLGGFMFKIASISAGFQALGINLKAVIAGFIRLGAVAVKNAIAGFVRLLSLIGKQTVALATHTATITASAIATEAKAAATVQATAATKAETLAEAQATFATEAYTAATTQAAVATNALAAAQARVAKTATAAGAALAGETAVGAAAASTGISGLAAKILGLLGGFGALKTVLGSSVSSLVAAGGAAGALTVALGALAAVLALVAGYLGYKLVKYWRQYNREVERGTELTEEISKVLDRRFRREFSEIIEIKDIPKRRRELKELRDMLTKEIAGVEAQFRSAKERLQKSWWFTADRAIAQQEFDEAKKRLEVLEQQLEQVDEALEKVKPEKVAEDLIIQADELIKKWKLEAETAGMSAEEAEIYKLKLQGLSEEKLKELQAAAEWRRMKLEEAEAQKKAAQEAERAREEIERTLETYREQYETLGLNKTELLEYKLYMKGATAEQVAYVTAVQKHVDLFKYAQRVTERFRDPMDKIREEQKKLAAAFKAGYISQETYKKALKELEDQLNKDYTLELSVRGVEAVEAGTAEALARLREFREAKRVVRVKLKPVEPEEIPEVPPFPVRPEKKPEGVIGPVDTGAPGPQLPGSVAPGQPLIPGQAVAAAEGAALLKQSTNELKNINQRLQQLIELQTEQVKKPTVELDVLGVA